MWGYIFSIMLMFTDIPQIGTSREVKGGTAITSVLSQLLEKETQAFIQAGLL